MTQAMIDFEYKKHTEENILFWIPILKDLKETEYIMLDDWLPTPVRKRLQILFPNLSFRRKKYNCYDCYIHYGDDKCRTSCPSRVLQTTIKQKNCSTESCTYKGYIDTLVETSGKNVD